MKYKNPTLKGGYSDPSICKANGRYYMVCSTENVFPGIRVMESEDLFNWEQIGWCITRKSQIDFGEMASDDGLFAPTIRYHNGRFYVVCTDNTKNRNFYVYTDDIRGEWSEPVDLCQSGIDPSLLFADGTCYFTSNGRDENNIPCIQQSEIDIETGKILNGPRIIWYGSGGRLVEGPHLYKIGDYYYLICAEGGTEYGHMETCARSKTPFGPFENHPDNPILTNRNQGDDEIQGTGHGELIQDYEGNWWIHFHGFRQLKKWRQYHILGREGFLMPVVWDENGWFHVINGGVTTPEVEVPWIQRSILQKGAVDISMNTPGWDARWAFLRNAVQENYRIGTNLLWLRGTPVTLNDSASPTLTFTLQEDFEAVFECEVEVISGEAGITAFTDERQHYDIGLKKLAEGYELVCHLTVGGVHQDFSIPVHVPKAVLRIIAHRHSYELEACIDATTVLHKEAESRFLSAEVAGYFNGVMLGAYSVAADTPDPDFNRFANLKITYAREEI